MKIDESNGLFEMIETDITLFLHMCSKDDEAFLSKPEHERSAEDYVRLMIIAMCLGLRGVLLRVLAEAEKAGREDEVISCFGKTINDYQKVKKTVGEFISRIKRKEFKQVAQEIWKEKEDNINQFGYSPKNLA